MISQWAETRMMFIGSRLNLHLVLAWNWGEVISMLVTEVLGSGGVWCGLPCLGAVLQPNWPTTKLWVLSVFFAYHHTTTSLNFRNRYSIKYPSKINIRHHYSWMFSTVAYKVTFKDTNYWFLYGHQRNFVSILNYDHDHT